MNHDSIGHSYPNFPNQSARPARMSTKKQIGFAAIAGVGFFVLLGLYKYIEISNAIAQQANFAMPPDAVTTAVAKEETWQRSLEAVGELKPIEGVTISNELAGTVTRIGFKNGEEVVKDQILIELDSSVEVANLGAAEAQAARTKQEFERMKMLRDKNAVSVSEYDRTLAEYKAATAQVDALRATIAKKRIQAPFAGRAGIRQVNVGDYVREGTAIVPLHSLKELYVNFTLPQQNMLRVGIGQPVHVQIDALPGKEFSGTLSAMNPNVNMSTRNVEMQAVVQNPEERLRPGMYAKVSVVLPESDTIIALPATAISYAPYGDSVFVLENMKDPKGKEYRGVRQQIVKLGPKKGDLVAITSGIKAGEEVVTSGVFKLRQGAAVTVNNDFKPGSETNPTPEDS